MARLNIRIGAGYSVNISCQANRDLRPQRKQSWRRIKDFLCAYEGLLLPSGGGFGVSAIQTMAVRNEEARRKALRLREEECLGLDEIASRVGVAKSTCYSWIRHRPLTEEGRRLRRTRTASASVRPRKERGERSVLHIMAEPHDYSPLETGAIAESATVLRLVLHRWKVLNSAFDGDVVDLYATRASASRLLKIQVRTARTTGGHGLPIVSLRRMHHGRAIGFSPGDFDILVGYSLYNDTAYVWTYEEIADLRCSVTVCDAAAEAWGKLDAAFERMGAGA